MSAFINEEVTFEDQYTLGFVIMFPILMILFQVKSHLFCKVIWYKIIIADNLSQPSYNLMLIGLVDS